MKEVRYSLKKHLQEKLSPIISFYLMHRGQIMYTCVFRINSLRPSDAYMRR